MSFTPRPFDRTLAREAWTTLVLPSLATDDPEEAYDGPLILVFSFGYGELCSEGYVWANGWVVFHVDDED